MNMLTTTSYLHYSGTCLSRHRISITLYHTSVSSFVQKKQKKKKQQIWFWSSIYFCVQMVNCFVARRNKKGKKERR